MHLYIYIHVYIYTYPIHLPACNVRVHGYLHVIVQVHTHMLYTHPLQAHITHDTFNVSLDTHTHTSAYTINKSVSEISVCAHGLQSALRTIVAG